MSNQTGLPQSFSDEAVEAAAEIVGNIIDGYYAPVLNHTVQEALEAALAVERRRAGGESSS